MKKCIDCKVEKPLKFFGKHERTKDGYHYLCKECVKSHSKEYYAANKEKRRAKSLEIYHRNHQDPEFRERRNARQREFSKEYTRRPETRAKQAQWTKKYLGNLRNRISRRVSFQIWFSLNKELCENAKKGRHWETLVGFTLEELMAHLESQFVDGMSWDNYGGDDGWQIDHRTPRTWFDFDCEDDQGFKDCWELSNLQPLGRSQNASKGNRFADVLVS